MTETQRSIIQPTDTDLLLGSIVREFAPPAPTLKGKDKGEKVAMFKSKVVEVSWDPRARAEASAWEQWEGHEVKDAGKSGAVTGRGKDPQPVAVRYEAKRTSLSRRWQGSRRRPTRFHAAVAGGGTNPDHSTPHLIPKEASRVRGGAQMGAQMQIGNKIKCRKLRKLKIIVFASAGYSGGQQHSHSPR
jgi:hypothetical protein